MNTALLRQGRNEGGMMSGRSQVLFGRVFKRLSYGDQTQLVRRAVAELQESVKGAPNNATFGFHLGMAYLADRQPEAARRTLQKALEDDPRSPFAANIRETLGRLTADAR